MAAHKSPKKKTLGEVRAAAEHADYDATQAARDRMTDATVLLTGGHVDELVAVFRATKTVMVRIDQSNHALIKSNRALINSNQAVITAATALTAELVKGRRRGEKDRRKA